AAYLRLRSLGTIAGTAYVAMREEGGPNDVFTASTATSSVSAPATTFTSTPITQVAGYVGIATPTPNAALDVNGSINIVSTGSINFGSYATIRNPVDGYAFGYGALWSGTTGQSNVAFGGNALHDNTSGQTNVAVGNQALYHSSTGYSNTGVG